MLVFTADYVPGVFQQKKCPDECSCRGLMGQVEVAILVEQCRTFCRFVIH